MGVFTGMKRAAVFLDRDGTINEQMGYVNHPSRFTIIPGAAQAIRLLNDMGYLTIIVSNQSGVARGYYPLALVHEIHSLLSDRLQEEAGAKVDAILFCPHHPHGIVPDFAVDCRCRKPDTGLIDQACRAFDIYLPSSFMIGDMCSDIEFANRAGIKGILVKTGYGLGEIEHVLPGRQAKPLRVAQDLFDAAQWIADGEQAHSHRSTP
jgi:D-glycero-D-manno-heptose 1,7-bisphosphate phosphatase